MSEEHDANRRLLLGALAGLTLTNVNVTLASTTGNIVNTQQNSRTLVAYFSRSGNTRVIAGVIQRKLKTDLFEIQPETAYPEDYFQTVAQAKRENDLAIRVGLRNNATNIEHYQTIYLGFPVWGTTIPPVVRTFISTHNLYEKIVIPFITHGGYGIGDSEEVLAQLAPAAKREKPLIIQCDQERKTTETVISWLEAIRSL